MNDIENPEHNFRTAFNRSLIRCSIKDGYVYPAEQIVKAALAQHPEASEWIRRLYMDNRKYPRITSVLEKYLTHEETL